MIRVLHVSTPGTWRGGEQQVYNLAIMQQESGEVTPVVLTPRNSELSIRLLQQNIEVIEFPSSGILKLSLARTIAQLARNGNFHLVHTHDSHAHTAAVLSTAVFGNPLPLVVHRRVDFAVSASVFSRWKYNHPAVNKIICVSEMILQITKPALREPQKLCVVYSGVDPERYAGKPVQNMLRTEFSITSEYSLIGNLSALADHKDYPTFIKAAREVLKQGFKAKFIIAGDGPEKAQIKSLIHANGLEKDVLMIGFRQDVTAVMQSLDIFLMTSKTEGLGTILIEAFMAGVPVVATNAGGIPELVKNGQTGLICDVGDEDCLAASITRLMSDAALRMELSDGARTFAQQFSHRHTAEKTLQVYREVLQ